MQRQWIGIMAVAVLPLSLDTTRAASMEDKASQEVLAAMERTSTWGHPDQYGEFLGMQAYASGDYAKAMKYFEMGARYADKLSQLSVGLMYLRGEGVAKDPVTAYAWLALAAERKFPRYVATRDAVWEQLDDSQRQRAAALLDQLSGEYGDTVAKVRMERALREARAEMTGSLVGYGAPEVSSITVAQFAAADPAFRRLTGPLPLCAARSIDGAPITGCGNIYVAWRWDPKQYFRIRDAVWYGTVTVGELEQNRAVAH
jgi:hypothetical protein